MKRTFICLLLLFICFFSVKSNVFASEKLNIKTNINILENYDVAQTTPSFGIKKKKKTTALKCSDVKFLHAYWVVIEIAAPILVILFGSFDFLISVISGDEQKIRKARTKFPKRLIAGVSVFLVFTVVSIVVGLSSDKNVNNTSLIKCIVKG